MKGYLQRSLILIFLVCQVAFCWATTFTVNNTTDVDNGLSDNNPAGSNSLRKCLRLVNASATGVTHIINFNITGTSPYVITLGSDLPAITKSVTIDGTSQPGYSNVANPVIKLSGPLNTSYMGLGLQASNSTVRGLYLDRLSWAVHIYLASDCQILNNVFINCGTAINIVSSDRTIIQGNILGTDVTNTVGVGNLENVALQYSDNTTIGGAAISQANKIILDYQGVNQGSGITILYDSDYTIIKGNTISSNYPVNGATGIYIQGKYAGSPYLNQISTIGTQIGGSAAGEGNNISNVWAGISFSYIRGITIKGNKIGTNASGTSAQGGYYGIWGAHADVIIGGALSTEGNLISGNTYGLYTGVTFNGIILGNKIGTNFDGTLAIPNSYGISLNSSTTNIQIGGSGIGEGNVISGNTYDGIFTNQSSSTIKGNKIGMSATNTPLGNGGAGIVIQNWNSTLIGGVGSNANIIAYNGKDGINVSSATGIKMSGNVIYNNGSAYKSINLNLGAGSNEGNSGKPAPIITSASYNAGISTMTLSGTSAIGDVIEIFASESTGKYATSYLGTSTTNGSGTWSVSFSGFTASSANYFVATATSSTNNTSELSSVHLFNYSICSGDFIWSNKAGSTASDGGYGIGIDNAGNTYVTGFFSGTVTIGASTLISSGGLDIMLVKYNAAGVAQWAVKAGGTGDDTGRDIYVDGAGNVYLTGWFQNTATFDATNSVLSAGSYDVFVARYNTSGVLQWVKKAGGTGDDRGVGISVDGSGNSYVSGWFAATATFGALPTLTSAGGYDIFLAQYNASGIEQWVKRAGSTGDDVGNGLTVDAAGNSFVTGRFSGTTTFGALPALTSAGGTDVFITKYNVSGVEQWAKRAGGTGLDMGTGLALDAAGNVYLTGYISNTATFGALPTLTSAGGYDIFLAQYNASSGVEQWAKRAGGLANDIAYQVVVDGSTNLYLSGYISHQASFGSLPALNSAGGYDAYVAKYNASGVEQWVKAAGSTGDDYAVDVAVSTTGNLYATGLFNGTVAFGTLPTLTSAGSNDAFIINICNAPPACSQPFNLAASSLSLTSPTDFGVLPQLDATALLKWTVNQVPLLLAPQYTVIVQVMPQQTSATGNSVLDWNSPDKTEIRTSSVSLALGNQQQLLSALLTAPNQNQQYFWRVGLQYLPVGTGGVQPVDWTDAQSFTLKGNPKAVPASYLEPGVLASTNHTNKINWVYEVTYLDEGKTSQSIQYLDGLGKSRQSQVLISSNATLATQVMGTETAYSVEGGGAVQSMAAPTGNAQGRFGYASRFFDVVEGANLVDFGTAHFDREVKGATYNTIMAPTPVDLTAGVGNYYSPNNTQESYADNAAGLPYAYSVAYKDPLNRPMLSGGVGPTLKITGGKEVKSFNTSPSFEELARIYGKTQASRLSNISKSITIDPNGVGSVTYTDDEGQVIATALTTCSSTPLNQDVLSEDGTTGFLANYNGLENDRLNAATLEKTSSNNFTLSCDNTVVTVAYQIDLATFYTDATTCKNCEYDLSIRIVEDITGLEVYTNTQKLPLAPNTPLVCEGTSSYTFSATPSLPRAGSYTVYRSLKPTLNLSTGRTILEEAILTATTSFQSSLQTQRNTFANEYYGRDEWYLLRKMNATTSRTPALQKCLSLYAGAYNNTALTDGARLLTARLGTDVLALAIAPSDTIFFLNDNRIRKITPQGTVSTILNATALGYTIFDIATDNLGNVYFTDNASTGAIRKVNSIGVVTTVYSGKTDKRAIEYANGKLYFTHASTTNPTTATNLSVITTSGILFRDNYLLTTAELPFSNAANSNRSLVVRTGNNAREEIYLTSTNNAVVYKIGDAGTATILAGANNTPGHVDGAASLARFYNPRGIAADKSGNLFVSDQYSIRKISLATGVVTTVAGTHLTAGFGDGSTEVATTFTNNMDIAFDQGGNLLVGDKNSLRMLGTCGIQTACQEVLPKAQLTLDNKLTASLCASDFTWAKQAGGTGTDNGIRNVTDAAGNVYVTGDFNGIATFGGQSTSAGGGGDIFLAKYDPTGTLLWVTSAGGNDLESSRAIALDAAGNCYVAGSFRSASLQFGTNPPLAPTITGSPNMFVVKYDPSGVPLWSRQAGGGVNTAYGVGADAAGNVYVSGFIAGTATFSGTSVTALGGEDVYLVKYNSSGTFQWVKQAGGTEGTVGGATDETSTALVVDPAGNSYVTGYFNTSAPVFGSITLANSGSVGVNDLFIAKYNTAGTALWAKKAGGTGADISSGVEVDGSGNVYVTGSFSGTAGFGTLPSLASTGGTDAFLAKYGPTGNEIIAVRGGGTSNDNGASVAVDANGNSYVTGNFSGNASFGSVSLTSNSGSQDMFVTKYDATGNVLWAKAAGSNGLDYSNDIAVDAAGNSYVTGQFTGTGTFGSVNLTSNGTNDIFVTKVCPGLATCASLNAYPTFATLTVSIAPPTGTAGTVLAIGQAAWAKGMSQEAFVSALVTSINSNYGSNNAGFFASNDKGVAYPGDKWNTLTLLAKAGTGNTYNGWKMTTAITYTTGLDQACFQITPSNNLPFQGGFSEGQCSESLWYADATAVTDVTVASVAKKQLVNLDGRQKDANGKFIDMSEAYVVDGLGTPVTTDAATRARLLESMERMHWTRPQDSQITAMTTYPVTGSTNTTIPSLKEDLTLLASDFQAYSLVRLQYKAARCEDQCLPKTFAPDCVASCEDRLLSMEAEVLSAYKAVSTYPATILFPTAANGTATLSLKALVDGYYPLPDNLLPELDKVDVTAQVSNPNLPSALNLYLAYDATMQARSSFSVQTCQGICQGEPSNGNLCATANALYNSCVYESYNQLTQGYESFMKKWDAKGAYPYTLLSELQTLVTDPAGNYYRPVEEERDQLGILLYNYLVANFRATADLTRTNWETVGGTCTNCAPPGNPTYNCSPIAGLDVSSLASKLIPLLQTATATCATEYLETFQKGSNFDLFTCNQNLNSCRDNLDLVSATYTQAMRDADKALCESQYNCTATGFTPIRLDCGSSQAYTNARGEVFSSDNASWYNTSTTFTNANVFDVLNTTEDALYRTQRVSAAGSPLSYTIPLPNGRYTVLLHLAEVKWGAPSPGDPANGKRGKRVFNLNLEGNTMQSNLDLFAIAGTMGAAIKHYDITVSDGFLNLDLTSGVDQPTLAALEILPFDQTALQKLELITSAVSSVHVNPDTITTKVDLLYGQLLTRKIADLPALLSDYEVEETCKLRCRSYFEEAFRQWSTIQINKSINLIINSFTSKCLPVGVPTPVIWSNASAGLAVNGNNLTKTTATVAWDQGAVSAQTIGNGGYVEATVAETNTYRILGLSKTSPDAGYTSIQYAIDLMNTGGIAVYELGVQKGIFGTYTTGDKIRIAVENNVVKYYRNTTLIYTSATAPSLPLLVDVSLFSQGATLNNVTLFDNRNEKLNVSFNQNLYHYTLYNYNRAGQLVGTTPPEGIDFVDVQNADPVKANRDPLHRMTTNYQSNSTGELAQSATPDGGTTAYLYDKVGRVRFSQNAEQLARGTAQSKVIFSYTKYEVETNRILETGEYVATADALGKGFARPATGSIVTDIYASDQVDMLAWPTDGARTFEKNYFYYDQVFLGGQENLSQRVSKVCNASVCTYYSYDKHGRVKRLTQELLDMDAAAGRFKAVDYRYQPLTSQVKEVIYQPVDVPRQLGWTTLVGVTANGNTLTKTAATAAWDAGAASTASQAVANNSYVEATAVETNTARMLGLSNTNPDPNYNTIQYALYLRNDAKLEIYEAGVSKGVVGTYTAGDEVRLTVENKVVKYYQNDKLLYTSLVAPTLPLLVDVSFNTPGATLSNVVVNTLAGVTNPVAWTTPAGVSVSGNNLTKTGGVNGSWDAGAASVSSQKVANNSYVESTVAETNTYRMLGLSSTNPDNNYTSIQYGLDLGNNGTIYIWESNVSKGSFGAYNTGDKVRVAVENNLVKYYRITPTQTILLYTSAATPTLPLLVDVSLATLGATLKNVNVVDNSSLSVPGDHFRHRYSYDADNRLIQAEVSRDSVSWARAANYAYYTHGPMKATGLGDDIQRLDYVYNLQGWLKSINHPIQASDPGQDGVSGSGSPYAKDVFGMVLHYYSGDYRRTGKGLDATAAITPQTGTWIKDKGKDLYNGNISGWTTYTGFEQTGMTSPRASMLGQGFRYDILNRLLGSFAEEKAVAGFAGWSANGVGLLNVYQENMTYDANGNIQTLNRTAFNRAVIGTGMDQLTYQYANTVVNPNGGAAKKINNRLKYVDDATGNDGSITEDFKDQAGTLGAPVAGDNYQYDAKGRMIKDVQNEIAAITWTAYDKVASVTRTSGSTKAGLFFTYDATGKRVSKRVVRSGQPDGWTFYAYDAGGNAMAIYTKTTVSTTYTYTVTEQHLYGSGRLGAYNNGNVLYNSAGSPTITTTLTKSLLQFELSDHLGNVRAVVTGGKTGAAATITMLADYYPFGMEMPGRKFSSNTYRYGFNGKEKDDEYSGSGNEYDYGFRNYDPRLGRFMSVDPLTAFYPELTPFQYAGNTPVWMIDLDGLEPAPSGSGSGTGDQNYDPSTDPSFHDTGATIYGKRWKQFTKAVGKAADYTVAALQTLGSRSTSTVQGFMSAVVSNNSLGGDVYKDYSLVTNPTYEENYQFGRGAGNVVTLIQGAGELLVGLFGEAVGVVTTPVFGAGTVVMGVSLVPVLHGGLLLNNSYNNMLNIQETNDGLHNGNDGGAPMPDNTPKPTPNKLIGKNSAKMSLDEIGEFLKAGKNWHKTSAKPNFLKKYKKELKGDTNADFYIDNDTGEVLLKSNKSGNWVRTGTYFE